MSQIEMTEPLSQEEPILKRLKRATQTAHQRAEGLVHILKPSVTIEEYRGYLERFWGFLEPLESALRLSPLALDPELGLPERQKVGLLQQDMEELGLTLEAIQKLPRCSDLPTVDCLASALGCCYVLEGSTLGGQFILHKIRPYFPSLGAQGFAYLECYGRKTGEMWKTFGRVISRRADSEFARARMEASAVETFFALEKWLATA